MRRRGGRGRGQALGGIFRSERSGVTSRYPSTATILEAEFQSRRQGVDVALAGIGIADIVDLRVVKTKPYATVEVISGAETHSRFASDFFLLVLVPADNVTAPVVSRFVFVLVAATPSLPNR